MTFIRTLTKSRNTLSQYNRQSCRDLNRAPVVTATRLLILREKINFKMNKVIKFLCTLWIFINGIEDFILFHFIWLGRSKLELG
jgi:hypothetical protein